MSDFVKDTNVPDDTISRQAAQTELMMKCERYTLAREESDGIVGHVEWSSDLISVADAMDAIRDLPSAQTEGWVKIPDTGIDDLSDGSHTFRQLYYQRMMLFATIVKQNREKAWKSLRHEDGELCFGGGWFIVGIDTPEGSYTYHYEDGFYSLFDCEELECAKHWDGHTEKDVTRLLSLPSAERTGRCTGRWKVTPVYIKCSECGESFMLIPQNYCPNCGSYMRGEDDGRLD